METCGDPNCGADKILRYRNYCLSCHRCCCRQWAADELEYPGGPMTGYILWVSRTLARWRAATGRTDDRMSQDDHAAFDAWVADSLKPLPF